MSEHEHEHTCEECGAPVCEHGAHGCIGADPQKLAEFKAVVEAGYDDGLVRIRFPIDDPDLEGLGGETCWAEPIAYSTVLDDDNEPHHGLLCRVRNVLAFYPLVSLGDLVLADGEPPGNLEFKQIVCKYNETYYIRYAEVEDEEDETWKEQYRILNEVFTLYQTHTASPAPGIIQICVAYELPIERVSELVNTVSKATGIELFLDTGN